MITLNALEDVTVNILERSRRFGERFFDRLVRSERAEIVNLALNP